MEGLDFQTTKTLKETASNSSLSLREKHLIGLAVTLAQGCDACTNRRFKEAMDDGITKQELIELTDLVALTNAGVVIRTALKSWDDSNDSNECIDSVCSVKN